MIDLPNKGLQVQPNSLLMVCESLLSFPSSYLSADGHHRRPRCHFRGAREGGGVNGDDMEDQSVETMDGPEEVEGPTAGSQNLPSRPSSPPNQQE